MPCRAGKDLWQHVSYQKAYLAYAQLYLEAFNDSLSQACGVKFKLSWESMSSPREYNFTTDRLFADIADKKVTELFRKVDKKVLDKRARGTFTSYDGFRSFYSPDYTTWGPVLTWDHNQLGVLIEALWYEFVSDERDSASWELMEGYRGNGDFDNIMWDALSEEGKSLVNNICEQRRAAEEAYRQPDPNTSTQQEQA